jgi:PAS domain S-box-containing protein
VNPAFYKMLGYNEAELEEMTFHDLTHPEDLKKQLPYYEKLIRGEITSYRMDKRYLKKDGEIIWVNLTVATIQDESGKPQYALIMAEDITEVRMAEENRRRLEAQLRQAQKMEAIGTLAGGIAHDFNNILGAIIGYTEMALFDSKKGSMEHYNMEQVLKAGHRAKDLVRQILAFSRKSEQDKKIISVTPIIKEVLKLLRASLPTTIDIQQHMSTDVGAIFADPTQLHQVLMNLCTNSAHAMEENGGTLEVSLVNTEIGSEEALHYPEMSPGPYVMLAVKDSGHGMDAKTLERIFDPYFTTKDKSRGTGMGLAVVHGIVKAHGGSILVDSAPMKGTTFKIFFPRMETEVQTDTVELKTLPTGNERVLLIDDEEALINLGENMLTKLGYTVETRTSPIEAIEAFKANPAKFDLIISDMTMPNMTGDALASEMLKIRPDIPILLCTGFSEQLTREKIKDIGIKGLLLKPLTNLDLARTVRQVLDAAKMA